MKAVTDEKSYAAQEGLSDVDEYFSDEEVANITEAIIEKHREALMALGNA